MRYLCSSSCRNILYMVFVVTVSCSLKAKRSLSVRLTRMMLSAFRVAQKVHGPKLSVFQVP